MDGRILLYEENNTCDLIIRIIGTLPVPLVLNGVWHSVGGVTG